MQKIGFATPPDKTIITPETLVTIIENMDHEFHTIFREFPMVFPVLLSEQIH